MSMIKKLFDETGEILFGVVIRNEDDEDISWEEKGI